MDDTCRRNSAGVGVPWRRNRRSRIGAMSAKILTTTYDSDKELAPSTPVFPLITRH